MDDYNVGPNGEDEELHSQSEAEEEELDVDAGLFVDDDFPEEEYQDVDADAHVDDDPLRTAEGLQYRRTDVRTTNNQQPPNQPTTNQPPTPMIRKQTNFRQPTQKRTHERHIKS